MFQTKIVAKIETHILYSKTLFFFENRDLYVIMWKNAVEPDRPQMTIWRTHIACCVPKARDTHSEYVILFGYPQQQWLHERASLLRYTYIAYLVTVSSPFKRVA